MPAHAFTRCYTSTPHSRDGVHLNLIDTPEVAYTSAAYHTAEMCRAMEGSIMAMRFCPMNFPHACTLACYELVHTFPPQSYTGPLNLVGLVSWDPLTLLRGHCVSS